MSAIVLPGFFCLLSFPGFSTMPQCSCMMIKGKFYRHLNLVRAMGYNGSRPPAPTTCTGGRSYNCNHRPHDVGRVANILCYRCSARLGCSFCCERSIDLICLNCHNYGTRAAVRHHKDIVPSIKVPTVRTDMGIERWRPNPPAPVKSK